MAYTKTTWEDLPSTNTPITANNLNNIENGIEEAHNNIGDLSELETENTSDIVNSINSLIPTILYNNLTGSTTSISLNDNYTNYKYIEIWGKSNGRYGYAKLDTTLSSETSFIICKATSDAQSFYNVRCAFNTTTITLTGSAIAFYSNSIAGFSLTNEVSIIKVIGYK